MKVLVKVHNLLKKVVFSVAYDSDLNYLWITQPTSIEAVLSGHRDWNSLELFTGVTFPNENTNVYFGSDNPTRDFVGKINYIETIMPGDSQARWIYVATRMQLLENGFIELPYEIEGGIDTAWKYDGLCHTASVDSKTSFMVSLPYITKIPDSTIDFNQEYLLQFMTETECSSGDCSNVADGKTTEWSLSEPGYAIFTSPSQSYSAQAVAIVVGPNSTTGATITVEFYDTATSSLVYQFTKQVYSAGSTLLKT